MTHKIVGKSLVVMQVNCRNIYNMSLDFWNLIDTCDPDVVIGTESWLREEISNAEIFRSDYTTFRRDRHARGRGVFICVKNYIACAECREPQAERLVPVYHKTNVLGLHNFLRDESHHGQVMVVAWRIFGNVLRKSSSRVSIVLSHIKF